MYSAYLKNNGIVSKCINLNIDRVFLKILFFPFIDEELQLYRYNTVFKQIFQNYAQLIFHATTTIREKTNALF